LDGVNLAGATTPSLTLNNVQPSQAGGYSVVVANDIGSMTSDTANLTVNTPPPGPPVILSITASHTVNAGENTSFTVVASGTGTLSYQWFFNDADLSGATHATLSFDPANTNNSGNYKVVVSNVAGSVTSSIVSLGVLSSSDGPAITAQPGNRLVAIGSPT